MKHSLSCHYPEECTCGASKWNSLKFEVDWYKTRFELLQKEQKRMRDPERTLVCDIMANGQLLPDPEGKRYGTEK